LRSLPGVSEDDVEIEVKERVRARGEGEGFHRVERSFGRFSRALNLPDGVDAAQVEANFDAGVLEVRVPKPEETKPTRIQIGKGSVEGPGKEK